MNQTPHRGTRKNGFTGAPGRGRVILATAGRNATAGPLGAAGPRLAPRGGLTAFRVSAALLVGTLAVLAFALVPSARAATGGASPSPVAALATPDEGSTTTTAFDGARLSFTRFRVAGASWYGGKRMWGRSTACGQVLRPSTIGVAHKRLPCGTPVKFVWHHHAIIAPVIDRGPYIRGRAWDLTAAAAEALDFEGIGRIRYAIAIKYARRKGR